MHFLPVSRKGSVVPCRLHPSRPDLTALLPRLIVRTNHWRINPVNPPPPHTEHSQGRLCGGDCGVWCISIELVQEKQSPHLIPLLHNSVFLSSIVGVIVRLDCALSPPFPRTHDRQRPFYLSPGSQILLLLFEGSYYRISNPYNSGSHGWNYYVWRNQRSIPTGRTTS